MKNEERRTMNDHENTISSLQILRTWCAVNPDHGMGLSADECRKAVEWLDDALALLKEQEPNAMGSIEFMAHIICEICDYAVEHGMEPNRALRIVADNIKKLLKISTFNNWKG